MTSEMQLHNETIELLCGHAAEKRLRASSAGGWTRMVSRRESVAHHESGHAVAAFALLGKTAHLLSIEQDHTIVVARRGWAAGGHCLATKSTEVPVRTGTVEIEPDSRNALRNCILLSRGFGALAYRRHYRRLQNEALKFCNDYWHVIHEIALKLEFRGRMNREEIHEILARTELFPNAPWTPPIWAPDAVRNEDSMSLRSPQVRNDDPPGIAGVSRSFCAALPGAAVQSPPTGVPENHG